MIISLHRINQVFLVMRISRLLRGSNSVLLGIPLRDITLSFNAFNTRDHILHHCRTKMTWSSSLLEGKIKGKIEVTRRRGRRRKKLLDDLKDRRGYCQLKEEALDRTVWRNCFGRGFGPVVWQITDDDEVHSTGFFPLSDLKHVERIKKFPVTVKSSKHWLEIGF